MFIYKRYDLLSIAGTNYLGRISFAREWAVELLPYGIRTNEIVVYEFWAPLYERWIYSLPDSENKLSSTLTKIPLENRMTTPREIVDMNAFLLSRRASHTTGQLMHVDRGYIHLDLFI